jgi:cytochrome c oxidase cbb3-type subunit 4
MYRQFFAGMQLTALPLFSMLFFLAIFAGVVAWVLFARRSQDFDGLARLPLSEPEDRP